MSKVFVSYRRQDSQAYASSLSVLLGTHLGEAVVFLDVDGISPGEDFVEKIAEQLSAGSVLLAVIGPRWLQIRSGWRRRLFSPNDFVRLEILAALGRPIEVIPVLVGGATMPPARSLPKSISALAGRNAMEIRDNRFRTDVAALATAVKDCVGDSAEIADGALQAERERVTHIIETDIRETRQRNRLQVSSLLGSALLVLVVAFATWALSQTNRPEPHFAEAAVTPDPTTPKVEHPNDDAKAYEILSSRGYNLRPQMFSRSRGSDEPKLTLSEVLGSRGSKAVAAIEKSGQTVFHAVGSTGNVNRPQSTQVVANMMMHDFRGRSGSREPSFLFLLGDLVLYFGDAKYYYDQFYSPYRNYPAPILAIAGNHEGVLEPASPTRTLDAFLANFCAEPFHKSPDARELQRTAQIQPGVYFTFEAPFVRILALYSNVSESQGVLSSQGDTVPELSDAQLRFLEAAFKRIKSDKFRGAVLIAVHHDALGPGVHSGSPAMLSDLDSISTRTGVWPHVVLSANSHSYQRFTRTVDDTSVQYVVAGTGGANLVRVSGVPHPLSSSVILQSFDNRHLGYLRVTVDPKRLHLDFQGAASDTPTTQDSFTLDLATRALLP